MSGPGGTWERVSDKALARARPPRTMAEAVEGDASLVFVLAVATTDGGTAWTVRLSERDDRNALHATESDAVAAADRMLAKLARVSASTLAVEAGLDPSEWAFEARRPVSGGIAFVNRREPALRVAREPDGASWRIMRGSIAAARKFPDPASAARVLSGAPGIVVPPVRGPAVVDVGDGTPDDPEATEAVVSAIEPLGPYVPVPPAYARDEPSRYTHVASMRVADRCDGTVHRAPLGTGDANRLTVGDGVGIVFGPRRADGTLPVTRILVRAPEPTPGLGR